ncbi:MAG TPA: SAF domain-containing protein [Herpetosiphonaceae bacterium]|nr:SAF domain-containing protein [Herpetosiphonaceae bacterium]
MTEVATAEERGIGRFWLEALIVVSLVGLAVLIGSAGYRLARSPAASSISAVVPRRELQPGTVITSDAITTTTVVAITGALTNTGDVEGRSPRVALPVGTPVRDLDLLTPPELLKDWLRFSVPVSPALELSVGQPVVLIGVKPGDAAGTVLSRRAVVTGAAPLGVVLALPPDDVRHVSPYLLAGHRLLVAAP